MILFLMNIPRKIVLLILKIISICLIFEVNIVNSAENIALYKPAYESSILNNKLQYEANKSTDGKYDQNAYNCAHGDKINDTLNWLTVDLLDSYYISEVILTPRSAANDDSTKRMDYVYIGISNSKNISGKVEYPVYPLCRQSPYTADPTKNMSISCRPNTPPGQYVIVQQPTTQYGYLTICEIQVFGIKMNISSSGNNTCQGNYYGDKCDKYCNCDKGVKCDQQGICPNGCDVNWKGDHCDIKKFNGHLIGCFNFDNSSKNVFIRINSQNCTISCSGYGFTFAANMTTNQCICTNTMNGTKTCPDNCSTQNCRQFYSVCPSGTYGYDCTLKCNCLNNGRCSYMEGSCEDGCAKGWTGDSCNIRNCSDINGDCDGNVVEDVMAGTVKSAIIGGVIGSIAGLCLILAVIILLVRYRKRFPNLYSDAPIQQGNSSISDSASSERKVKFQVYPEYVNEIKSKLVYEYQNLNRCDEPHDILSKYQGLKLNRFKNIVPYQHNRVKLVRQPNEGQSDYINASYIEGIIENVLIAAQAPVKNTVNDFWGMIYQQNIGIIIMLCNYVERKKMKCEHYLPDGNTLKSEELTIQSLKTTAWPSFIMTELRVSGMSDKQRSLIHLHYTEWPDHGVPNNVFSFLDFCRRCQKLYESYKCGVLVHCSAGIGRTGSFLAIYDLLVKGYQGLDISVPETVKNLRKQRMKMVEKQAQYNFIYEALAEEVKIGQTSFSRDEFTKFYNSKDGGSERQHLMNQHKILSDFYSRCESKSESTLIKAITGEYRFSLLSKPKLITWTSIPDSQCVVIFDTKNEFSLIPKKDRPICNGQINISLVDEKTSEFGKIFEVQRKVGDSSNYENVIVNAYENSKTLDGKSIKICVVERNEDYLDFVTFMELFSQLPTDANIVVILGNNPKLGYFFVAACNIISQLKVYDEVAILQNVCELCKVTDYQPSQISFEMFHQIVHDFILTSG